MKKTITIDPISRISGFLDVTTEIEDNLIKNAKTSGLLYRGFEKMLKGRDPLDAIFITERICGICSTSHALASSLALENAMKIKVDINDLYIRDLIHGFEFLQNHLRQFYLFTLPDYVILPKVNPLSPQEYTDYRLPEFLDKKLNESYVKSIEFSRLAHEGLAVLGGKAPHGHGIFLGGVTVNIDSYKLEKVKSIISQIKNFIYDYMLEDIKIISEYYPEYFYIGKSYENYMSFGLFTGYSDSEISYVNPGIMVEGKRSLLDINYITEGIKYSWYLNNNTVETVDIKKPDAYSFIKCPRYNGLPMEVGPLARLMITGEYTNGNSCMDRNVARVLETKKIIDIMENIAVRIRLKKNDQKIHEIPNNALGIGLIDTIRGSLGHWVQIDNKIIKNYNIITPSAWNLSPIDQKGIHGPAEKSLIGTKISNLNSPAEIGRIIRSFDPCISCGTH